jgi:hypothetical protein
VRIIPLLLLSLAAVSFATFEPAEACLNASADCDGDGYTLATEQYVFGVTNQSVDWDACGNHTAAPPINSRVWPADVYSGAGTPDSTDFVTIQDLTSFLAPVRRLDTSQNDPAYNRRWDLVPGNGNFLTSINIQDLTNLITVVPRVLGERAMSNLTPCSSLNFQPEPPIQAAFFYPWFPQAWDQQGYNPFTNYTPSLGWYSSTNDITIDQQLTLAKQAHLEAFIGSWWGPGDNTDTALQYILSRTERAGSPYPEMRWAVYHENESQGDPSPEQIVADLEYLAAHYFWHDSYLRIGGKPVVFVYADGLDGAGMAARWAQAKALFAKDVHVVLKVYSGYAGDPNQPDSWHQYGPAVNYSSHLPYQASVSPGFWKKGELEPRLVRDVARFEGDLQQMVASGAFWQIVVSWNEWGEGTSVEPSTEFGSGYLDAMCRQLPGSIPCAP